MSRIRFLLLRELANRALITQNRHLIKLNVLIPNVNQTKLSHQKVGAKFVHLTQHYSLIIIIFEKNINQNALNQSVNQLKSSRGKASAKTVQTIKEPILGTVKKLLVILIR